MHLLGAELCAMYFIITMETSGWRGENKNNSDLCNLLQYLIINNKLNQIAQYLDFSAF